jgi:hypothetical protein
VTVTENVTGVEFEYPTVPKNPPVNESVSSQWYALAWKDGEVSNSVLVLAIMLIGQESTDLCKRDPMNKYWP